MEQIFTFDLETKIIDWDLYKLESDDYELQENETSIKPPDGLYQAKWDGSEWVESGKPIEIEINVENIVSEEELEEALFYIELLEELENLKHQIKELKGE